VLEPACDEQHHGPCHHANPSKWDSPAPARFPRPAPPAQIPDLQGNRASDRRRRRLLTLRPREEHAALGAARVRETQEGFAAHYRLRADIEGTLWQAVRTMHLRRARYIGLAKVHLQHVLTAAALNLVRVAAWLVGHPLALTRQSAFVRLMAHHPA
jgi:hypothetical protein